jgi:hypothetical protein
MVHLYLNVRSGLGDYFKNLGSIHGKLFKKWHWELDHYYYSRQLLEVQFQTETIFRIAVGILGYSVDLTIYNQDDHDTWR